MRGILIFVVHPLVKLFNLKLGSFFSSCITNMFCNLYMEVWVLLIFVVQLLVKLFSLTKRMLSISFISINIW